MLIQGSYHSILRYIIYTLEQNVIIQNLDNNKDTIQVNVFISYKACLLLEGSCAETLLLGAAKGVRTLHKDQYSSYHLN